MLDVFSPRIFFSFIYVQIKSVKIELIASNFVVSYIPLADQQPNFFMFASFTGTN